MKELCKNRYLRPPAFQRLLTRALGDTVWDRWSPRVVEQFFTYCEDLPGEAIPRLLLDKLYHHGVYGYRGKETVNQPASESSEAKKVFIRRLDLLLVSKRKYLGLAKIAQPNGL
jgi:hypothetical protein